MPVQKAKLKQVLKGYQLPSFPALILQILQKIRNPYSSSADIAQSLSLDPGLSSRLLSIANSAAFSPKSRVANLTQAIALVGLSQLESLVLGVGVAKGIPNRNCPAKESECFTAAFLQDMALPFLACTRGDDYDPIFKKWHLEGGDLARLEREVFDWDHAEVAAWICAEWEFPENIALAIRNHHSPDGDDDLETAGPVRLVSLLKGIDTDDDAADMILAAEARYNISKGKMQAIIEPSFEKARDFARIIA